MQDHLCAQVSQWEADLETSASAIIKDLDTTVQQHQRLLMLRHEWSQPSTKD